MDRSMETPVMRCSDSARLVSGNLPMSSATIPSTTPCESRFRFIEDSSELRIPVTTISSSWSASWFAACVIAGARTVDPSIKETARATGVRLNARIVFMFPH